MNNVNKRSNYIGGVFYEDGVECYLCSHPINITLSYFMEDNRVNPLALSEDHIMAKINGGGDVIENIKPVHAYCNFTKGVKDINEVNCYALNKTVKNFMNDSVGNKLRNYFTCLNCGELFTCEYSRLNKYNKKYCSNNCKNIFLTSLGSIIAECDNCGESFKVVNSRVKIGKGKYCSMFCYNSFGEKRRIKCQSCERFYYLSVDNKRLKPSLFCSSCR